MAATPKKTEEEEQPKWDFSDLIMKKQAMLDLEAFLQVICSIKARQKVDVVLGPNVSKSMVVHPYCSLSALIRHKVIVDELGVSPFFSCAVHSEGKEIPILFPKLSFLQENLPVGGTFQEKEKKTLVVCRAWVLIVKAPEKSELMDARVDLNIAVSATKEERNLELTKYCAKNFDYDITKIEEKTDEGTLMVQANGLCKTNHDMKESYGILVKTLTGRTLPVVVTRGMTVFLLKRKLWEMETIPQDQQRIVANGRTLEDASTMEQSGVIQNSVIHMILRLRGGMFHYTSGRANGGFGFGVSRCGDSPFRYEAFVHPWVQKLMAFDTRKWISCMNDFEHEDYETCSLDTKEDALGDLINLKTILCHLQHYINGYHMEIPPTALHVWNQMAATHTWSFVLTKTKCY